MLKTHCELGYQALLKAEELFDLDVRPSFLTHAKDIARTHQEKWDGSGYPYALSKNISNSTNSLTRVPRTIILYLNTMVTAIR